MQGYVVTQYNIGVKYGSGNGVPQNKREGHIWISLAAFAGLENAIETRKIVKQLFTSSEIESAQQEVQRRLDEINNRKN